MQKKIAFIGAGSHADAVFLILDKNRYRLVGYFDDKNITQHDGFPVLGKISDARKFLKKGLVDKVFITIGDNEKRKEVFDSLRNEFYDAFINIVSPKATVLSPDSLEGNGIFVGSNAFIGAKVKISDNSIINTASVVEHHSVIGAHVNIAPNATVNGICHIESGCYLGSGSIVIQLITIAPGTLIGAGAVVVKNIEKKGTYAGVPARMLHQH